ncbi:MAG: hypothetical protein ACJAVO_002255 [Parvibaculaceae bacterium]|jgi:hypothetical protein
MTLLSNHGHFFAVMPVQTVHYPHHHSKDKGIKIGGKAHNFSISPENCDAKGRGYSKALAPAAILG